MLAILTNTPTPYRTAFFNELAATLAAEGIAFHVLFCAAVEPGRPWHFDPAALRFAHTLLPGIHPRFSDVVLHANPSVLTRLRTLRPTWLLVAGAWNTPTMLLGSRRFACRGARRVFWSEGHADNVRHPNGPIAFARRRVLRHFDAFAVPNARSAEHIRRQVGEARIFSLPNTVDENLYRRGSCEERGKARARIGIDPATRLLVQVSNLIPRKGVRELAEAYASLDPGERRGSSLAFVGGGPLEGLLRSCAAGLRGAGEIRVTGPQQASEVRDWLMAADAFFLAAHADANPLAPIEASFAALPIFLSRHAGNAPEIVDEGRTGFALSEISPPGLAEGLRRALRLSDHRLRDLGRAARANAERHFRRAAAARQLIDGLRTWREAIP